MRVKKDCQIVAQIRHELQQEATRVAFRQAEGDFSRQPTLTLPRVATLILRGHQMSQQNAVNKFFRELGMPTRGVTGSAYCQARQKIKPALFAHLNTTTVTSYAALSSTDGTWRLWRGRRLLGADGTKLNLPDTRDLRAAYSVIHNQYGAAGEGVQALGVVLYDLLNDLGLAAHLGPLAHEPDVLMNNLFHATQPGDLLVLDRNFPDYALIAWSVLQQRDLLIRCTRQSFSVVNEFWAAAEIERVVTLRCSTNPSTRAFVKEHGLPLEVTVRLLKFTLPTGETEVLLTTLCDLAAFPRAEFYVVYGKRWGNETYYDRLKNIFELERFSGVTPLVIEQDFYGVIFLATLESTLAQSAQALLTEGAQRRATQATPQVNRAVSYVSLLDHTVTLLADPDCPLEDVVTELHRLLQTNPKYNATGRKFERRPRSPARSLRYQRYRKRLTC